MAAFITAPATLLTTVAGTAAITRRPYASAIKPAPMSRTLAMNADQTMPIPANFGTTLKPLSNVSPSGRVIGSLPGDPDADKFKVTVHDPQRGTTYQCMVPKDRYIWYEMESQGFDVPASCRNGCCTTCAVKIDKGIVEQEEALGLLKEMRDQGYALLCVSFPRSDIVATLQSEDEVYVKQFGGSFEKGGVQWGGVMPEDD